MESDFSGMRLRDGKVIPSDGDLRIVNSDGLQGGSYIPAYVGSSDESIAISHDTRVLELEKELRKANLRVLSLEDHIEQMSIRSNRSSRASLRSESRQGSHSDQYHVPPSGSTPRQVNTSPFVPSLQNVRALMNPSAALQISAPLDSVPLHVPTPPDALTSQASSALPATRVPVYPSHAPQPFTTPTYRPDLKEPLTLTNEPLRGNHPFVAMYREPPASVQNDDPSMFPPDVTQNKQEATFYPKPPASTTASTSTTSGKIRKIILLESNSLLNSTFLCTCDEDSMESEKRYVKNNGQTHG
ncbi:hypothetical protein GE061_008881 [Apolygus lucorum]|uniref:Uncharacterized protein n=1 Tax=Apolygus lucorum TaxID=248454 RepID=A0A6A4K974_APOLU|nr:hypothetical protein GE061_008881 [Apolygus lucorum]